MDKYTPVSCELHSELELVIIRNQKLKIQLTNSSNVLTVEPYDIISRNKSEFLRVKNDKRELFDIRLDLIHSFQIL